MKIPNIKNIIFSFLFLLMGTACEDFLVEDPISNITTDSYATTESGHQDLVKACYPLLRDIILQYNLVNKGTDIIGSAWDELIIGEGPALDAYNISLNPNLGDLSSFWDYLYQEIARTNTAIQRAEGVTYADAQIKEVRVAEAKFLRALSYFYLVQTWGDVPMPLFETAVSSKKVIRTPSSEVYAQILKDLTEAEAVLPVVATDYGRVTKGAAQFLLA